MPKSTFYNLPDDKKERILKAAKQVFSQTHYQKATIDMIVECADIPKGSFYQYFYNKDDLFKFMFKGIGVAKADVLTEEMDKFSHLSFSDLMIRMLMKANEFETKDYEMIALKDRFLKECPQEVKKSILMEVMPESVKLFKDMIEIYIEKGDFNADINADIAAFAITSVIINLENYELKNESDHGEVLRVFLDMMERGLKKTPVVNDIKL
ncbi:MAG TPA: TetR/AcrR family transcriptional regulator [Clostridiales bacterium]|nr:TetR/AcrR family transcriptional regulator [Clostridiales bacterium]